MMYYADHGEELQKKFCHGTDYFYANYKKYPYMKDIVQIPIYFVLSDKYKAQYQGKYEALLANHQKYYTNDMSFDTMLGLMNINGEHYRAQYDVSSPKYDMTLDRARTIHGKVLLSDCL